MNDSVSASPATILSVSSWLPIVGSNPMSGLTSISDSTKEMEMLARQSRELGYEGLMAIHPSHVPIINEIFSPSGE